MKKTLDLTVYKKIGLLLYEADVSVGKAYCLVSNYLGKTVAEKIGLVSMLRKIWDARSKLDEALIKKGVSPEESMAIVYPNEC